MKVTFKGKPVALEGSFITPGMKAPDFSFVKNDLSEYTLADGKGQYLILNIFPSLDTGLCATTVRRFNQMAAEIPGALVLCISKDLPFAQHRFCVAEGIERVMTLSDFRNTSRFGEQYGVLIDDGPMKGLLARAVVVINPQREVVYSELVPEITQEPDYKKVLSLF